MQRQRERTWLAQLEAEEREKTGIKNLKIKYNKVFGYYFEVTNSFKDLVPDYFIRKQTLTNAERYTTDRLKELEDIILGAEDKLFSLEYDLFCRGARSDRGARYCGFRVPPSAIAHDGCAGVSVRGGDAEQLREAAYQRKGHHPTSRTDVIRW